MSCVKTPRNQTMKHIATALIILVLASHLGFLVLEMFFWTSPYALRAFGMTPEFAQSSKVLAANQGLYNGFLAAGLLWGLLKGDEGFAQKMFFLGCVIIAGIFGAATAKTSILFIQALPAALALGTLLASRRSKA
jgi:putative membrane protein